jgi:hypothetical protein
MIILTLNTASLACAIAYVGLDYCKSPKLTYRVAVVGFRIPGPDMANLMRYRDLNIARKPYFKAWGSIALIGDTAICCISKSLLFGSVILKLMYSDLLLVPDQGQCHAQAKEAVV